MTLEDWLGEEDVVGLEHHLTTGCGSLHVYAYFDNNGNLRSVHLDDEGMSGCSSLLNGLSRIITLAAENGVHIKDITNQLDKASICPRYVVRCATSEGAPIGSSCCPSAIACSLTDMWVKIKEIV